MKRSAAEIIREYGPFPGVDRVGGVTFDGQHVWFASGGKLNALDPANGKIVRSIDVVANAPALRNPAPCPCPSGVGPRCRPAGSAGIRPVK